MDTGVEDQAEGIHQQVAFTSVDLFAAVETVWSAHAGGLDRLTIDNTLHWDVPDAQRPAALGRVALRSDVPTAH